MVCFNQYDLLVPSLCLPAPENVENKANQEIA